MPNVDVTRTTIGPEAQADSSFHDEDLNSVRFANFDPALRLARPMRRDEILAYGFVGGIGWLVAWLILGVASWLTAPGDYADPSAWHIVVTAAAWLVALGGPVILLLALVQKLVMAWLNGEVMRARAAVTRDRFMNPIDVASLRAINLSAGGAGYASIFERAAMNDERTAPYETLRGLEVHSPSYSGAQAAAPVAPVLPDEGVRPLPPDLWLAALDKYPHLLLAAATGGGKSVMASVILDRRVRANDDRIVVLDPHWSPNVETDDGRLVPKWGGVPPAARSHTEIRRALRVLTDEYTRRLEALNGGEVVEGHFEPMTIIIDEVPEVVSELRRIDALHRGGGRQRADTWRDTAALLGSGARKVNMRVILSTQSPLVEDIGMNSSMRKNFARVALTHGEIAKLAQEDTNRERVRACLAAIEGRAFPAAVVLDGVLTLLDRSDLLARVPERLDARSWEGFGPARSTPSVRSDEAPDGAENGDLGPDRTDGPADDDRQQRLKESIVVLVKRSGGNRAAAREELQKFNMGLSQEEYGDILRRHGLVAESDGAQFNGRAA